MMKPLFIPLNSAPFDAFRKGEKKVEYRSYGPRWNEQTCVVGRPVVLSRGYGKQARLTGTIRATGIITSPDTVQAYLATYGLSFTGPIIAIFIDLDPNAQCEVCAALFVGVGQVCPSCFIRDWNHDGP